MGVVKEVVGTGCGLRTIKYRGPLFYCAWLYWTLQILCVPKVCGNPALSKSTGVIFSNRIHSLCVSVSQFVILANFKLFIIMVICGQ